MSGAALLGDTRLGGSNVQTSINGHGIGTDHNRAVLFGNLNR